MPRVGCELLEPMRVTLVTLVRERANCHLSLTFGIAIGGGRGKTLILPGTLVPSVYVPPVGVTR